VYLQLWGEQYARRSEDVLTTQAEIARAVGSRIRDTLSRADTARLAKHPTKNPAAYEAYLQSRFFENKLDPASLVLATGHAETAVKLDPSFALAWAGLGRTWLQRGIYYEKPSEAMPNATQAVQRALSLDPEQPDAHVVLGLARLLYDWNWDDARRELTLSNTVRPQVVETFTCAAHLLETAGGGPQAELAIRQALVGDPMSVLLNTELGCNSYYQRRYDVAIAEYRRTLELDATNVVAYWGLGRAYAQTRDFDRALKELRRVAEIHGGAPPIIAGEMGYVFGLAGDRPSAERILASLEETSQKIWVDPYLRAIVYLGLGDRDRTMTWLDKAFELRSPFIPSISSDAKWDAYQADPRFAALLAKSKLTPARAATPPSAQRPGN